MPLPWIINNLYGLASRAQANERGLDAAEQLMDKMKAQYNDPGIGPRPPDPEPLFNRVEGIAQAQGGQAAFNYLLGQTDPAQLAEIQARQTRTRQAQQELQGRQRQFEAFQTGMQQLQGGQVPGVSPATLMGASMMEPGAAGATIASTAGRKESTKPSSVREYEYYDSLKPEDQSAFMMLKRAQQFINTGGGGQAAVTGPGGQTTQILTPEAFAAAQSGTDVQLKDDMRRYGEQVALPDIRAKAKSTVKLGTDALTHPGFDAFYGVTSLFPTVPESDAANFEAYARQGQGQIFLQAYESLKGAGQITEIEGQKAEQAMGRIFDRRQSPKSAREAWQAVIDAVQAGLARQEQQANTSYGVEGPVERRPQTGVNIPPGGFPEPQTEVKRYVPGRGFQ